MPSTSTPDAQPDLPRVDTTALAELVSDRSDALAAAVRRVCAAAQASGQSYAAFGNAP